jgi:hypothetical protein
MPAMELVRWVSEEVNDRQRSTCAQSAAITRLKHKLDSIQRQGKRMFSAFDKRQKR